jgi:hypothetical protein
MIKKGEELVFKLTPFLTPIPDYQKRLQMLNAIQRLVNQIWHALSNI